MPPPSRSLRHRPIGAVLLVAVLALCVLGLFGTATSATPGSRFRQDPHLPPTVISIDRILAGPGDVAIQLRGNGRPGSVVAVYDNAVCHGTGIRTDANLRGRWVLQADIPRPGDTQVPPRWISVRGWVTNGAVTRCRIVQLPDSARSPVFAPGTNLIGGIDYAVPQGDGVTKVVGWIADLRGTPRPVVKATVPHILLPGPPVAQARARLFKSPVMSRIVPGWVRGFVAFVDHDLATGERVCAQTQVNGFANEFACIVPPSDPLSFDFATLGRITSLTRSNGVVRVSGWAARSLRRQPSGLISVRANGRKVGVTPADLRVQGLARFLPGMGGNHGFDYTFPTGPGRQRVCVFIEIPPGFESLISALDCRTLPPSS